MISETILVTGATGFLGSHLVPSLSEHFDTSHLIFTANHDDAGKSIQKMDLTHADGVALFLADHKPSIVIHAGGYVDLSRDYETALKCIRHNLIGTTNLLEALKTTPPSLFIYISTEEVYGTNRLPYKEDDLTNPPSPYAVTKLSAEYMCRIYSKAFSIPSLVIRVGTMYGPNQPKHRYIMQTIEKAVANEPIPLNSGVKRRDYVYVSDVVDALVKAITGVKRKGFEIINIGGGVTLTLRDFVNKIVQLTGSSSALQIGAIPDRISEADEWLMDITKAKALLGWEPVTDFDTGLLKTIEWNQKSNQ